MREFYTIHPSDVFLVVSETIVGSLVWAYIGKQGTQGYVHNDVEGISKEYTGIHGYTREHKSYTGYILEY